MLLELRHDPAAPVANPRSAGLFHTAFLLPTRADLGQWLLHAADLRVPLQGASDHLVSEAIYLADPEGNGIEVYRDRPSETWALRDGVVQMDTLRLDLDDLAATANKSRWSGLPEGSCIGHVHLQVGALEPAERFYAGLLGFDVTCRYPGATFFGSGGYHHHIGTNIWNSAGAPVRQPGAAGLASIEIIPANTEISTALHAAGPSASFRRGCRRAWHSGSLGYEPGAARDLTDITAAILVPHGCHSLRSNSTVVPMDAGEGDEDENRRARR